MPTPPPEGFLTRPEAAKLFNRSQRALERDLNLAMRMQDADVLQHWRLVTKEGESHPASEVSTDKVKQLVSDGMSPTWYIAEAWLEQEYGRKGSPEPSRPRDNVAESVEQQPANSAPTVPPLADSSLRSEIEFLKERIRTLEQEKREDATRSEKREAKLFEQLEVKDKQISAWDEVTQGLTRGLATGQLIPSQLSAAQPGKPPSQDASSEIQDAPVATEEHKPPATKKKQPAKRKPVAKKKQTKSTPPKKPKQSIWTREIHLFRKPQK